MVVVANEKPTSLYCLIVSTVMTPHKTQIETEVKGEWDGCLLQAVNKHSDSERASTFPNQLSVFVDATTT